MQIPDGMPQLRSGTGETPADGGCVIQVASYLWNGEWTDNTPCVHPVLRVVAIKVNDLVDDTERQKLWDLIPRLVGTASDDKHLAVSLAYWSAERVFPLVREQDREVCRAALAATKMWLVDPCEQNADAAAYDAAYAAAYDAAAPAAYDAAYDAAYAAAYATNAAADAAYAAAYDAAYAAAHATNAATAAYDAATAYAAATNAAPASAAGYDFLVDLITEYERLTNHQPTNVPEDQWVEVRELMTASA